MNETGDLFKGGIHFVLGSLAATACLYNALEWTRRSEVHSAVNVAVYGGLWIFELYQTRGHWAR